MSNLDELKAQADKLGVKYHHMAGEAKIQAAIDAHLAKNRSDERSELADEYGVPVNPSHVKDGKIVPMTSEEYRAKYLPERKKNLNRLIRCRVTCMNPAKRAWEGEIISVGSAKNGTFKKFIPFDGREWHIPKVIYDELLDRKCTVWSNGKDSRGRTIRKGRLVPEFSVQVLDPLTRQELDDLKKQQALANAEH